MTTIFERAAAALATLSVPYACQVYRVASGTELPDLFVTYTQVSNPVTQSADDIERLSTQRVQVNIWNRAGLINLPDVDSAMTAAGFRRAGDYQLPYDRETGHYGLERDYVYLEEK